MELQEVETLYLRIGYRFHDPHLATVALTHKSYSNENPTRAPEDNERLEFLGDAVLDFIVSGLLMDRYPSLPEGDLSKLRASLVNENALALIARELELGRYLRMGKGERLSGGMDKESILSDALEALLAAIYLDSVQRSGIEEIRRVVTGLFAERMEQAGTAGESGDFKTELQERMQSHYKDTVRYVILSEEGPDHDKKFEAAVLFRGQELGRGIGRSKKHAEQEAARQALSGQRKPTGKR